MQVHKFTFNPFQENTYLLINSNKEAVIIDPGCFEPYEEQMLTAFIEKEGVKITGIICTHCHLDHVFGAQFCTDTFKLPVIIPHRDESTYNQAPKSAAFFGMPEMELPTPTLGLETPSFQFGSEELEIRFTPGHSVGHVVFVHHVSKTVIGGDVLFNGSIGRTDLPGGDFDTLAASIKEQLYTLPDNYTVYSGHGPETTIGYEKVNNPFVKA